MPDQFFATLCRDLSRRLNRVQASWVAHRESLTNWLAIAVLLAVGVVWPPV